MKKKVILSTYCSLITILTVLFLFAIFIFEKSRGADWEIYFISALMLFLLVISLIYMPLSVSADSEGISINRPLKKKRIPYSEIAEIRISTPTMGEKRIAGSGGFLGYWGWFGERDLGKYFAYYGKSSDTFFVTLKNGRKYMIGCSDAWEMAKYISGRIG